MVVCLQYEFGLCVGFVSLYPWFKFFIAEKIAEYYNEKPRVVKKLVLVFIQVAIRS